MTPLFLLPLHYTEYILYLANELDSSLIQMLSSQYDFLLKRTSRWFRLASVMRQKTEATNNGSLNPDIPFTQSSQIYYAYL